MLSLKPIWLYTMSLFAIEPSCWILGPDPATSCPWDNDNIINIIIVILIIMRVYVCALMYTSIQKPELMLGVFLNPSPLGMSLIYF